MDSKTRRRRYAAWLSPRTIRISRFEVYYTHAMLQKADAQPVELTHLWAARKTAIPFFVRKPEQSIRSRSPYPAKWGRRPKR